MHPWTSPRWCSPFHRVETRKPQSMPGAAPSKPRSRARANVSIQALTTRTGIALQAIRTYVLKAIGISTPREPPAVGRMPAVAEYMTARQNCPGIARGDGRGHARRAGGRQDRREPVVPTSIMTSQTSRRRISCPSLPQLRTTTIGITAPPPTPSRQGGTLTGPLAERICR